MDLALAFEDSQPFKLTVEQYRMLHEAGAFDEHHGRVELIEGMIACMSPQTILHGRIATRLTFRLQTRLLDMASPLEALMGPTVLMPPHNAPDPDITVARPAGSRYFSADAVALLVEVARTSLRKDMKVKRDVYARAGVPEYWVVDVEKALVHRFHRMNDDGYRQEPPVPLAGPLASLTIPDLVIDGAGIL